MPDNPPSVTVYGIVNCDSVKKSRAWLTDQGIGYQFHDFKKQGLAPEQLDRWLAQVGWERLLNRQGTTWRRLDDAARASVTGQSAARSLMLAQPSLVKRPVVEWSGSLTVGFDPLRWAALAAQQAWPVRRMEQSGRCTPRINQQDIAMHTETLHGVSLTTQANVYFDGKCVSHSLTLPGGVRKSVGVVLPATLRFNTAAPEVMECVAGSCDYRLDGATDWRHCGPGERFSVGANSAFEIRVTDAYHYICHFG